MKCPNCGNESQDDAVFCDQCGTRLKPAQATPAVGQARASEAIRFGTQIEKDGFNLFVIGPNDARMPDALKSMLAADARARPSPSDWVYVNNFDNPEKPVAIELPSGRARRFQEAMHELIDDLTSALPAVFQSEDYQNRHNAIDEAFQRKQAEAFSAVRDKAAGKNIILLRTPVGFALAPAQDGQVVPRTSSVPGRKEKRREIQATIEGLEKDLEHVVRQIPQWEKQRRDELRQLNRNSAKYAVDQQIDEAKAEFDGLPRIIQHIETVRADLVENVAAFIVKSEDEESGPAINRPGSPLDRYEVNVLVTQDGRPPGAPIVEELHPTLGNLLGNIEYVSQHGVLVTNFRQIKAGAIHRANGGYLLLDVRNLHGAVQLVGTQAHAAPRRDQDRGRRPLPRIHQHGVHRAGSNSVEYQGHSVRRSHSVLPAGLA